MTRLSSPVQWPVLGLVVAIGVLWIPGPVANATQCSDLVSLKCTQAKFIRKIFPSFPSQPGVDGLIREAVAKKDEKSEAHWRKWLSDAKLRWISTCVGEVEREGKKFTIVYRDEHMDCPAVGAVIVGDFSQVCHTHPPSSPGDYVFSPAQDPKNCKSTSGVAPKKSDCGCWSGVDYKCLPREACY